MIQRFADRENDVTYKTQFQGHFKGVCNRNLRKIVLNSVKINTLHVGLYMIELSAITSIHVILLQILAVLGWPFGTLFTNGQNVNIA